jgi:hypothetical protein
MKTKICTKCKQEKELSEFSKHILHKDSLSYSCKVCQKNYSKKYRKCHKKQIKLWCENNREKLKRACKRWRKENKDKIQKYYVLNLKMKSQYTKEYNKIRRNSDINFKLLCNIRDRLSKSIKRNTKSASTKELLGCTVEFLKNHLQSQFKRRMTWKNYGRGCNGKDMKEWHIDHIKPCAKFDLSKPEEQQKCFHYTNLQPLWAKENRQKN